MKSDRTKNILLWIAAVVFTISLVIYQRATGPTYPQSGTVTIGTEEIKYNLLTSHDTGIDAPVIIETANKEVAGELTYKRYKSHDEWTTVPLRRQADALQAALPFQPPAGKIIYTVKLFHRGETFDLSEEPVIIRFKGAVPLTVLTPHIFFMFISLLFTLRAGLEAIFRRKDTLFYTGVSLFTLVIGGLILGPIVQKYAFDAYWTGWPFGHDLTDNKTAFIFIFLLIAWLKLRKNPLHRTWVIVATVVMIVVYAIPHSVLGSEIDHTKTSTEQTSD
jgi:hypothetical protein